MVNIEINNNGISILTVDDVIDNIIQNRDAIQHEIDQLHASGRLIGSVQLDIFSNSKVRQSTIDPTVSPYINDVREVTESLRNKVVGVSDSYLSACVYTAQMSDLLVSIRSARKEIYNLVHYHLSGSISLKIREFCKQWTRAIFWTARKTSPERWIRRINAGLAGLKIPYKFGVDSSNHLTGEPINISNWYLMDYLNGWKNKTITDKDFTGEYLMQILIDNAVVNCDFQLLDQLNNIVTALECFFINKSIPVEGMSDSEMTYAWHSIRRCMLFATLINYRPDIPVKVQIGRFNIMEQYSRSTVHICEVSDKPAFCNMLSSFDNAIMKSGVDAYGTDIKPMLGLGIVEYSPLSLLQPIKDTICAMRDSRIDGPMTLQRMYKIRPDIIDQYIADKMFTNQAMIESNKKTYAYDVPMSEYDVKETDSNE